MRKSHIKSPCVRSLTLFEENIVVTVLAKLVPLFFFKSVLAFFFLMRSLIDWCQSVTGSCKNNVSKFVGMSLEAVKPSIIFRGKIGHAYHKYNCSPAKS